MVKFSIFHLKIEEFFRTTLKHFCLICWLCQNWKYWDLFWSCSVLLSNPMQSCSVLSSPVQSYQIQSKTDQSCKVLSFLFQILIHRVQLCSVLLNPAQFYQSLSNKSNLVQFFFNLARPAQPYLDWTDFI